METLWKGTVSSEFRANGDDDLRSDEINFSKFVVLLLWIHIQILFNIFVYLGKSALAAYLFKERMLNKQVRDVSHFGMKDLCGNYWSRLCQDPISSKWEHHCLFSKRVFYFFINVIGIFQLLLGFLVNWVF